MADTAELVKTNSYGFFGYVVPGVVATLYLTTVVSYLRYGEPLHILVTIHENTLTSKLPSGPVSSPYAYISFVLVFVVAAYIVGHLAEACANMIYDRFYMRRIYGHRLRQLILDEGTDRKETHKNFYRTAIAFLFILAFVYLLWVSIRGQGFRPDFGYNAGIALCLIAAYGAIVAAFWRYERSARREEDQAYDYLKECEAASNLVSDSLRDEKLSPEDQGKINNVSGLYGAISRDTNWSRWLKKRNEPLERHLEKAAENLKDGTNLVAAKEALEAACSRMRWLKSRNSFPIKFASRLSVLAEIITRKFIDDERPISRQVKERFHARFEEALKIKCGPSLGSEVNRLPMWYIVENQKDLSSFIIKYRAQAAMMCNISGAFLLCTLFSVFAFQGCEHDRDFAIIGIVTLFISMFTSLRYFHVHDNDYVKTLIYAFVIGTAKPEEPGKSRDDT